MDIIIGVHIRKSSLNWTTTPHLALIAEVKWRNMIFKNRRKFLTLKQLVCLPEFYLESIVLSTISVRKWWCLKLLSSRKIIKFLVLSTKRLLKSWLKRLLWPTLLISFPFPLQLSFASLMTSTLNMIFLVFLRLFLRTLKQSGEWVFQSRDEDELYYARFWKPQYHNCSWE